MFTWISTNANCSQALSIPRHIISKLEEVFWGDKDICRSPMRHLLKSNAAPSDSEVVAIRALLSDAEASIDELHRRFPVHDHESQLIESQLLKSIEAHRALLSLVRCLPSEILEVIFLHYADGPDLIRIGTMPWRLGHISYRWRKIALSLPSLWDNIPRIYLPEAGSERSYLRALTCLLQRSGTSPTLKFDIRYHPLPDIWKVPPGNSPIVKEIMLHSERIEQLRIDVNKTTMPLFRGFKGRIPNLRILRVYLIANNVPKVDVFENAPALRQVTLWGDSSVRVLLPWSQITYFEEQLRGERVGNFVPLSSLRSLTNLYIDKPPYYGDESATPYRPTTLPNLRILKVKTHTDKNLKVGLFLESLTIPAVEDMKILHMAPLIPHLVSMFSGSRGPSRLQRLTLGTIRLQTGDLSALLLLTPHLVELDIGIPPTADLLRFIYGEGEVILVPMLQALYIRIPGLTTVAVAQIEHFNTLARVRCELASSKDLDDATTLSLGSGTRTCQWTTLHTLRFIFDLSGSRNTSQKRLNNWSSSYTMEEAKAIDIFSRCCNRDCIRDQSFLKTILSYIECYEITNNVLLETNLHIKLQRNCIGIMMKLPDEDKLKQRVMHVLAEWDQLLLNDFSDGGWARTFPELYDFSLVYVSKSKVHEMRMSADGGKSIVYGLQVPFDDWLQSPNRFY